MFRDDLGCSDLEWQRGRAWAFEQAMDAVWYYAKTNPAMSQMGLAHPGTHPGRRTRLTQATVTCAVAVGSDHSPVMWPRIQ